MIKSHVGTIGLLLGAGAIALGGCAVRRDHVVLIEPSYSFVQDFEARAGRLALENNFALETTPLTIAVDLSSEPQRVNR